MNEFEALEQYAYEQGILVTQNVIDDSIPAHGVYLRVDGHPVILIKRDITMAEKTIALREELAHFEMSAGNILDQSKVENRKAEALARSVYFKDLLPAIRKALRDDCQQAWEISESSNIPQDSIMEIFDYCQRKGISLAP